MYMCSIAVYFTFLILQVDKKSSMMISGAPEWLKIQRKICCLHVILNGSQYTCKLPFGLHGKANDRYLYEER